MQPDLTNGVFCWCDEYDEHIKQLTVVEDEDLSGVRWLKKKTVTSNACVTRDVHSQISYLIWANNFSSWICFVKRLTWYLNLFDWITSAEILQRMMSAPLNESRVGSRSLYLDPTRPDPTRRNSDLTVAETKIAGAVSMSWLKSQVYKIARLKLKASSIGLEIDFC